MPVAVKGLDEVRKSLRRFAPEVNNQLNRNVRKALTPVITSARNKIDEAPEGLRTGWTLKPVKSEPIQGQRRRFPKFDANQIKRGIMVEVGARKSNQKGYKSLYRIINANAAGAIYETSGRANPSGKNAKGAHFISAIERQNRLVSIGEGKANRGRVIFAAWKENQGKALAAAVSAVEQSMKVFKTTSVFKALRK